MRNQSADGIRWSRIASEPVITAGAFDQRLKPVVPQDVTVAPPVETAQQPVLQNDGSVLILIPAGEFLMGATPFDTQAEDIEKPAHPVMLKEFWIDQTEVTNDMFIRFVDETGYLTEAERDGSLSYRYDPESLQWLEFEADWRHPSGPGSDLRGKELHPVVHVNWEDAAAYCSWAGKRLPTDAEWEKAARGAGDAIYPWGNQQPDQNLANFNNPVGDTRPVGSYPDGMSPNHIVDMSGNVSEWVADWFASAYYASSPKVNPTGPTSGRHRVLQGRASASFSSSPLKATGNR